MNSDLVVVVADRGIEQAILGLLQRPEAIGIRQLQGVEFPAFHGQDGGTYARGHELARAYLNTHRHALVVFDADWEGRPTDDVAQMENDVEGRLGEDWGDRGRCVVIQPELEVWVWSDSPHVASELGWESLHELRAWLESKGLWSQERHKPDDPKKAYIEAIREKRKPKSNATFGSLARKVSVNRCQDRAFLRLRGILREWFGVVSS